ncbi:MAG: hypothetical protein DCC75_14040 [Proteobacteria bacterium]|nr:MAG: hypothetical protein DCC75_14040 [Pseudomonadota bacterium]
MNLSRRLRALAGVKTRISLFILLVLLSSNCLVWAEAQDSTCHELKARYFKLRNTDPKVLKVSDWQSLETELRGYLLQAKEPECAAQAHFQLSVIYELLFSRLDSATLLADSLQQLADLETKFPHSLLADDALVRRAELALEYYGDRKSAKEDLLKVLNKYPRSDQYTLAHGRLKDLEDQETLRQEPKEHSKNTGKLRDPGFLVMIDAGHGGEDFGAHGVGGLLEKDVTLAVALELRKLLMENLGVNAKLTRTGDTFVPLAERTQMANDYEASLFISLHSNASPDGKLKGLQTFYLDTQGDEASRLLAERENIGAFDSSESADLQFILSDLIQSSKMEESIAFARKVHAATLKTLRRRWSTAADMGVRKAPFYVLVGAHMPCILIEMFFIDNPTDGGNLASKEFRRDLALGIFEGIKNYYYEAKSDKQ